MARGKGTGAKRGPKPQARREDVEALEKKLGAALRRLTKLVRAVHAEVVPGSTEGIPEPEPVESDTPPASVDAELPEPPEAMNGAAILPGPTSVPAQNAQPAGAQS